MTDNQEKEFKKILMETIRKASIKGVSDGFIAGITFVYDKIKSGMSNDEIIKECDLILKNSQRICEVAIDRDNKS